MKPVEAKDKISDELLKQTTLLYLAVVLCVLVSFMVISSRINVLKKMRVQVSKLNSEIAVFKTSLETLDKFGSTVTIQDQDLLVRAIPIKFDPGSVLTNIRSISQKAGVNITEYSMGGGKLDSDRGGVVKVKLDIVGTRAGLLDFIDRVENALPVGNIVDLQVSEVAKLVGRGASSSDSMSLGLTIEYSYFQVPKLADTNLKNYLLSDQNLATIQTIRGFASNSPEITRGGVGVRGGNRNLFED